MAVRKIRLDVDEIRVVSFTTDAADDERGTVRAHHAASGASCPYACTLDEPTCNGPACVTIPVLTCLC
jgi:hypothetical protein